jgi:hypothetical protein
MSRDNDGFFEACSPFAAFFAVFVCACAYGYFIKFAGILMAICVVVAVVLCIAAACESIYKSYKNTEIDTLKHYKVKLNTTNYYNWWENIANELDPRQSSTFKSTIFDADKLLDLALCESGFNGDTMRDRLISANKYFSDPDAVWDAHKLRNNLAHAVGFHITFTKAKNALSAYKQALKDLGAL